MEQHETFALTLYKRNNSTIETTIYCNHLKQLIRNITIGQFLRLHINCSSVTDFQSKAVEMKERFHHTCHPTSYISSAYILRGNPC